MFTRLTLLTLVACLGACQDDTESMTLAQARTAFFEDAEGTDRDCADWLDWCIDQGYDASACEERSEYCVDGEWVGGGWVDEDRDREDGGRDDDRDDEDREDDDRDDDDRDDDER